METCIIIPVKTALQGKSRLARLLEAPVRQGLIHAMITDILAVINQSPYTSARKLLVTADLELKPLAATYKVEYFQDPTDSLNHALSYVVKNLDRTQVDNLVIIPSDIPLLQPDDLDQLHQLVAQTTSPHLFITPSLSGGTNLLCLNPIDLIPPSFGPESFRRHSEAARRRGYEPQLYSAPTIRLDVDTEEDLARFLRHQLAPHTHTYQFLLSAKPDLIKPSTLPKPSSR